jgi:hypothetical protein
LFGFIGLIGLAVVDYVVAILLGVDTILAIYAFYTS